MIIGAGSIGQAVARRGAPVITLNRPDELNALWEVLQNLAAIQSSPKLKVSYYRNKTLSSRLPTWIKLANIATLAPDFRIRWDGRNVVGKSHCHVKRRALWVNRFQSASKLFDNLFGPRAFSLKARLRRTRRVSDTRRGAALWAFAEEKGQEGQGCKRNQEPDRLRLHIEMIQREGTERKQLSV